MQTGNVETHRLEVRSKQRFEFGKNWQYFLRDLNEERIVAAEVSLRQMLDCEDLSGKTLLDVGSGSGLFSLAARRLGAKVLSFDYDPASVACASQLRDRFFSADQEWRIEQGSALDQEYLSGLGQYDVVYSWGVLHHTGQMWRALENITGSVKPGGKLFIAIYNDQGRMSDLWRLVKRTYNRAPRIIRPLILWPIGVFMVTGLTLVDIYKWRRPRIISKSGTTRGMSMWADIVDWIGGYPFEVASRSEITDFYEHRGFRLDRLVSCGRRLGCNQFVFTKVPSVTDRFHTPGKN